MNFDASFDWRPLCAWLFTWPPTPLEFVSSMVFAAIIGACSGVIWRERRWQRWLTEHTRDLLAVRQKVVDLEAERARLQKKLEEAESRDRIGAW